MEFEIRKGRRPDSVQVLKLVNALADFEHLEPPSPAGQRRLLNDIFEKKRVNLLVADYRGVLIGYALYFYNYSSFEAKPSLYLEDLFVLPAHRKKGTGFALFKKCVEEAIRTGCGRMEWAVLDWNSKAMQFYESLGARKLDEWRIYRLDAKALRGVSKRG